MLEGLPGSEAWEVFLGGVFGRRIFFVALLGGVFGTLTSGSFRAGVARSFTARPVAGVVQKDEEERRDQLVGEGLRP